MKTLLLGLGLISFSAFAGIDKQFPRTDYTYRPTVDRGFGQYLAPSLHGTKKLVLTFDDGPHPTRTPELLDILKEYQVKATFFVLTELINEQTLPIVERMVEEGHILASHDHDHDDNNKEPLKVFRQELVKTVTKIESILDNLGVHRAEMYYRFPYGAYGRHQAYHHLEIMKNVSRELYGDNCINFAFWDIDTADWVPTMTAQDIAQGLKAQMEGGTAYRHQVVRRNGRRIFRKVPYQVKNPKGGGVVLMHDIHQKTVDSVRITLENAKQYGWEIVPLSAVKEFAYGNKECIFQGPSTTISRLFRHLK